MMELRDYQVRAVEQINAASSAIYTLPTGGGKTVIFCKLIEELAARGERVLVIVHRVEILDQTSYKLASLGIDHGVIKAGRSANPELPVQLASIQTLARRVGDGRMEYPRADVVIVDECHHARAMTWRAALDSNSDARRYGFTATPCRGDGAGLGDLFNGLIIGPQVAELQKTEPAYLVGVKYFAPAKIDLQGVRTQQGDYAVGELAARMNRAHLVGDIVTQWHRLGEGRRTIVFAVDVGHSVHIRDEFVKAGVKCEHLDGGTDKDERKAILERLESGATTVVTNCMVLTEGFDCPPVGCIVLARPTKQVGLYRQMAGRGLRPAEGKDNLILIDHSGAVHRHGLLEDEISWTLDVDGRAENEAHAKRTEAHLESFVDCSQCGSVRERGTACPNCGFKPGPRPDLIITKDADLVAVGQRAPAYSVEERQRWLSELMTLRMQRNQHRASTGKLPLKPEWAGAKFKDKFGDWPPRYWSVAPAMSVSPEISSWVRARDIAYAKAMQKAQQQQGQQEQPSP
jgi:DNA repair protein RadD